jgi:hypothetical protein
MTDEIDRKAFVMRALRDAEHRLPPSPLDDDSTRRRNRSTLAIFERMFEASELSGDEREAKIEATLDLIHADPSLAASFSRFMTAIGNPLEDTAEAARAVPDNRAASSVAARLGSVADGVSARLQDLLTRWEGEWTLVPSFAASRSRGTANTGPSKFVSDHPDGTFRLMQQRFPDPASGLVEVVFQVFRPGTSEPLVASRNAWRIFPVLDGHALLVVPEEPNPVAWKLADLIALDDLERVTYEVAVLPPGEAP